MARVLLVDDHPDLADVVRQLLEVHGHKVDCCPSGEEALQYISSNGGTDAVVADQRLPGISGLELLERIRSDARFGALPVVICSADDSIAEQVAAAGGTDFWTKGSDRLFDKISEFGVKLRSAADANHA